MGEKGAGKAILGLALLAWVAYTAWPKVAGVRQIASIPKTFASAARNELTTLAAVGLPEARTRNAIFYGNDTSYVAPAPSFSPDERTSKLKEGQVYLHAGNFAAAGSAFARIAATNPDDVGALQGLDAARRRLVEAETGGDAASLRQSIWFDLLADAEEAHADGRYEEANVFINWLVVLMTQTNWPEAEEFRSSERFVAVGLLNTPKPEKAAESNLTFQLPDEEEMPEASE